MKIHAAGWMKWSRRNVWTAALVLAGLMLLWPPWSSVGTRISAAGYGFLFTGPLADIPYGHRAYRLDMSRLFTQLAALAALAGIADALTRPRGPQIQRA